LSTICLEIQPIVRGCTFQFYKSLLSKFGFSALYVISSQEKSSDLPSWCPDLNSEPDFWPISGSNWAGLNLQQNLWQRRFRVPHVSSDSNELEAYRCCVDVVVSSFKFITRSAYRQLFVDHSQDAERLNAIHNSLERCMEFLHAHECQLNSYYKVNKDLFRKTLAGRKIFSISDGDDLNAFQNSTEKQRKQIELYLRHYYNMFLEFSVGRSFFITSEGRFGLGSGTTQTGDRLCVLFGATGPYLLRSEVETSTNKMVGDVYVADLMKGEVFELRDFEKEEYDTFVIR
jgi:hypothetical protein